MGVLEVLLETISVVVPYTDKRERQGWDRQIKHLPFVRNTVWVRIVRKRDDAIIGLAFLAIHRDCPTPPPHHM